MAQYIVGATESRFFRIMNYQFDFIQINEENSAHIKTGFSAFIFKYKSGYFFIQSNEWHKITTRRE